MLFTQILSGVCFSKSPTLLGQKLIMVFSYRSAYVFMLYTHKNARGGRYTTVLFTQKILEYLFKKKNPYGQSYHGVSTSVIRCALRILSSIYT